ncbi:MULTISPECIES: metal ABC transporter solute-binding protein, Zn/Mn family [unclassified Campylobacter]|uniref:metal ABC transporter solute-binding protein, Zn/Mn family n=1 Tax=unclassified Campylobacter TaxID=2593542 RepID=UPI0022EA0811|nr:MULTISPECIES: zinc ABC transporter substrate-binding protein [unclassified Campylobacter]MDA3080076.1 zinc ABC transporter substrate-binding protein [Campylobacter sp. CS_NA2]MDA3081703.1 zinc ABC transporter substrate-binding protein [Campylobacter sp. CS_NA1]MDA3086133.1 zinc ABC transporter substrate-binding protein [Campylobacter sp. CS_ED1]MDA3090918.1 zinc ABC transporter substrate-binding protein [Campylobacter sp. CS_ED2]WBR51187.1 zinc ABC transporter substrate-binding protein [Cam
MKKSIIFMATISSLVLAKPIVSTTIMPTKFFIEQIAGDELEINVMVPSSADPHTYEPKPSQMKMLEKSDLYFEVGVEFDEIWLKKIAPDFKNVKFIKTQENIKKIAMNSHHDHGDHDHEKHADHKHDHDKDHDAHHEHGNLDPHIWLDPILVKTQSKNILNALCEKYTQKCEKFSANFAEFEKKLDELDEFAKAKLKDLKDAKFIVYHPSWGYFAVRYDLEQIAIEIEGKEPKPADLAKLIEEAKEENVKVIFVAPQFSKKAAITVAAASGANVEEIDHLSGDWLNEMKKTIEIISKSLK